MATFNSSIRENVRDYNIICAICQDEFNDPVMIDCHHSFCRTCIEPWVDRTSNRQRSQEGFSYHGPTREFKCPTCKSVNKLPRQGIAGFPKSFYIEQLKEAEAKFQSLYQAKSQSPYPMCVKHKTEDLRFYCTECETLICRDCKVLKHEGHTAECVSDVANNMRAKLKEIINTADEDLETLRLASKILYTRQEKGN